MAPSVVEIAWATPWDLAAPVPLNTGAACSLAGVAVKSLGAAAARYFSKFWVVPEASERKITLIFVDGSVALGLTVLMAGSFQVVILPVKILASRLGVTVRSVTPLSL